jgi:Zn-dependent protease/CBS domain-containing protein
MWSWHIGSIRGISLKIHVTFPLVLLWAAFQFGGGRGGDPQLALFGSFLVLVLFVCVLLHELGHALVARQYGIPVEDITLLPIGGVARLRIIRDSPAQEFVIALAGPLVNIAIAALLLPPLLFTTGLLQFGGGMVFPALEWRSILLILFRSMQRVSLEGMLAYLFFANVMLALFNLLPAFPMDGGRILRALLALLLPYRWATIAAVRAGQLVALLLLVWGFRMSPGLLLIAIFVFVAGSAELQRVALRDILVQGQVGAYMLQGLQPLYPQWNLYAARLLAQNTGQRAFPVVQDGALLGLLSVREIQKHSPGSTVGEAMVQNFPVLNPTGSLYDAQILLQGKDHFAAAVMEGGVLLGLLSLEDIDRAYHSLRRRPRVQVA